MGVYDTVGSVQLKITGDFNFYNLGDEVPFDDGVYVGYEGVVVIKGGVFIVEFEKLTNKWGGEIDPSATVDGDNPITKTIKKSLPPSQEGEAE